MAYRPKFTKTSGSIRGISKVMLHPNKPIAKIIMQQKKDEAGNIEEVEYIVKAEDQDRDIKKMLKNGTWYITLSGDGKKVYGIRPVSGVFNLKFDRVVAEEGKAPAPKESSYTFQGKLIEETKYTILLTIADGNETGMVVPVSFRYWYTETVEEGKSIVSLEFHPKARDWDLFVDFHDAFGVWQYGPMTYKDNILPELQERLKRANRTVKGVMAKGFLDSLIGSDNAPDVE